MNPEADLSWFRKNLSTWFAAHGRILPWRGDRNPYHVLIAERMLHRTRASQVVQVYHAFLTRYPDVAALAAAEQQQLMRVLAPLGLTWRSDTFIPMARYLIDHHDGLIPSALDDLLAIPGVGPYTAAAVQAFAYGEPVAVVDTNTIRVAGRYLQGAAWVGDARKQWTVRDAVTTLLDPDQPAESNHAILDLGALICVAGVPLCSSCPVAARCRYRQLALAAEFQPQSTGTLKEGQDE